MTKRDFQLIADAIAEAKRQCSNHGSEQGALNVAAHCLATSLATTNPRFDRARFINACLSQRID